MQRCEFGRGAGLDDSGRLGVETVGEYGVEADCEPCEHERDRDQHGEQQTSAERHCRRYPTPWTVLIAGASANVRSLRRILAT